MARTYAEISLAIWEDRDWTALTVDAQWLYTALLTQTDLSLCGVIAFRPARWAGLAAGMSEERVVAAARELHAARFLVIDDGADQEVLVRAFLRRDRTYRSWQALSGARTALRSVRSTAIRASLATELTRIDDAALAGIKEPEKVRQVLAEMLAMARGDAPPDYPSDYLSDGDSAPTAFILEPATFIQPTAAGAETVMSPLDEGWNGEDGEAIREARARNGYNVDGRWGDRHLHKVVTEVIVQTRGLTEDDRPRVVKVLVAWAASDASAKADGPGLFKSYTNELVAFAASRAAGIEARRDAERTRLANQEARAHAVQATHNAEWVAFRNGRFPRQQPSDSVAESAA